MRSVVDSDRNSHLELDPLELVRAKILDEWGHSEVGDFVLTSVGEQCGDGYFRNIVYDGPIFERTCGEKLVRPKPGSPRC